MLFQKTRQFLKKLWYSICVGLSFSLLLAFGWGMYKSFLGDLVLSMLWNTGINAVKLIVPTSLAPYAGSILTGSFLLPLVFTVTIAYLTNTLSDYPSPKHKAPFYWTTHWLLPSVSFFFACQAGLSFGIALGVGALFATTTSLIVDVLRGDLEVNAKKQAPILTAIPNSTPATLVATVPAPAPSLLHGFQTSVSESARLEATRSNELQNLVDRPISPQP